MVKVCGMKDAENMKALAALQPHMMGLIFYDKSPRYFTGTLPELNPRPDLTGVFVNAGIPEIIEKIKTFKLDFVQLHGEESPDYCKQLKGAMLSRRLTCPMIKAFPIATEADFVHLIDYHGSVERFLFDSKGKYRGGNGTVFNWELLEKYTLDTPYLLSGGIGPEDTKKLETFMSGEQGTKCIGIDVNSKFETAPGYKDIELLRSFIEKLIPEGNTKK